MPQSPIFLGRRVRSSIKSRDHFRSRLAIHGPPSKFHKNIRILSNRPRKTASSFGSLYPAPDFRGGFRILLRSANASAAISIEGAGNHVGEGLGGLLRLIDASPCTGVSGSGTWFGCGGGGVSARGGVSAQGGVSARGGVSAWGGGISTGSFAEAGGTYTEVSMERSNRAG